MGRWPSKLLDDLWNCSLTTKIARQPLDLLTDHQICSVTFGIAHWPSKLLGDLWNYSLTIKIARQPLDLLADHQICSVTFGIAHWPSKLDRKSTRLNSSHVAISYTVF